MYKLIDRPTGQILHITNDHTVALKLTATLLSKGYKILILKNGALCQAA